MVSVQKLTKRQKQVLKFIHTSIKNSGYPPTLADLREELDVVSNQAVIDVLSVLERKGFIKREEGTARGIRILDKGFEILSARPLIPSLGFTAAGPYKDAFENLDWQEVEDMKTAQNVFIVDVTGDSMTDAGIKDGDKVIIQQAKEFRNGDVVLARDNDGTTIKRLINSNGRIYLKPENPKYQNIPIYPETRLLGKVIGKVASESN
ncbi:MAG: LexA repressor [Microgenomates group bacterium GW2011_GWC1_39_7b]|uniref:LexA repressor n=3 Tax=Candidatus Woeseibacteriota TaxID=1752722 RepID=A0A0G0PQV6_9BACT|nr:MAG: LexA repressor [Candidatus Woesebacteria bacterium GW2011_GWB1_39_10]KKR26879.1 MAG: LexA repressor [Microgenomates group bacterium GW2011_GWC1_39_7b]KKR73908.1 MAG: LexA repressor [Candidatus Woesebacteria bacterium GW2011_GWA2_40_7]KKS90728.1 MAG: LexA repressor [Candidatus Woesebacteria bacterium GW2011_GWA1_43_12]